MQKIKKNDSEFEVWQIYPQSRMGRIEESPASYTLESYMNRPINYECTLCTLYMLIVEHPWFNWVQWRSLIWEETMQWGVSQIHAWLDKPARLTIKHQNKQISVVYRANLKLGDLLKVPNNAIKCIYSEIQGTWPLWTDRGQMLRIRSMNIKMRPLQSMHS